MHVSHQAKCRYLSKNFQLCLVNEFISESFYSHRIHTGKKNVTPTCLFHLCANQNNKQQQHIADTDLSFSLRPGIWLYLVFPELVLVCTNHQGLSYTHRARRGASSAVPLCSCAVGTLGGLALSILPSSTELWQDNVSPHGRCAARPENLRKKKTHCVPLPTLSVQVRNTRAESVSRVREPLLGMGSQAICGSAVESQQAVPLERPH